MKLRIAEAEPGELLSRAVDAVRVIERITGRTLLREDLRKAVPSEKPVRPSKRPSTPSKPQFKFKVLNESVDRGHVEVERIRKLMLEKMGKVLS
jgi:hypothetical protein